MLHHHVMFTTSTTAIKAGTVPDPAALIITTIIGTSIKVDTLLILVAATISIIVGILIKAVVIKSPLEEKVDEKGFVCCSIDYWVCSH